MALNWQTLVQVKLQIAVDEGLIEASEIYCWRDEHQVDVYNEEPTMASIAWWESVKIALSGVEPLHIVERADYNHGAIDDDGGGYVIRFSDDKDRALKHQHTMAHLKFAGLA